MLVRLGVDDERDADFECEEQDLTDFFFEDSANYCKQLIAVTYIWYDIEDDKVTAYFSMSNDSISRTEANKKAYSRAARKVPNAKRVTTLPAVKIGRLAVHKDYTGRGIGSVILNKIKDWFIDGNNKTGCRFIVVDALNNKKAINFYKKNEFKFLLGDIDEEDKTRLMFFDLTTVKQ